MGHRYYKSFYDIKENVIYINTDYGMSFYNLFHEMGHWLLCLFPMCTAIRRLNMMYDDFDFLIQKIEMR